MVLNLRIWMKPERAWLSLILLLSCCGMLTTTENAEPLHCYKREKEHDGNAEESNPVSEMCTDGEKSCFLVYDNKTGMPEEKVMGCWPHEEKDGDSLSCDRGGECKYTQTVLFCCCSTSNCNRLANLASAPVRASPEKEAVTSPGHPIRTNNQVFTMVMSLVPLVGITFIVMVAFWLYKRHKFPHEPLATQDPNPQPPPPALRPLQLKEIKASGRFGCVWKAQMLDQVVAVKMFPLQELQSFQTECDIYNMPHLNNHYNILKFIGAEKRGENLNTELWLITEFHEKGSLHDYLKRHLLTWSEALHLATTMVQGLAYLHQYIPPTASLKAKPGVAHRDFKSKNVLVKHDLSVCLADFGLAITFDIGKSTEIAHSQVGTRRYMSPEILEGSISFNQDDFFRIDMYACGLVLWEIVTRCTASDGPIEDYQLPFEKEVGLRPSLEEMQEVIIHQKKRPELKEAWYKHPGLAEFCRMIEECWDQDAEARLSASCVWERLIAMERQSLKPSTVYIPSGPPPPHSGPLGSPPAYLPPYYESSSSSTSAVYSSNSTQDSTITLGPPTANAPLSTSMSDHAQRPNAPPLSVMVPVITPQAQVVVPQTIGQNGPKQHPNGPYLNGTHSNGPQHNGQHLNGPLLNGQYPNGPQTQTAPQTAITSIYSPSNNQGNITTTLGSHIPPQAV